MTLVGAEEDVFTDEMVGGDSTDAWRGNRASEFAFDYRITASDDLMVVLTQTDIDRRRTCPIDVVGCVEIARYRSSEWIAVHKGDRSVARLPKPPLRTVETDEEPIGAPWEMICVDRAVPSLTR